MPLVRLQCPACKSIVKITSEIAAQHPLVRCAKCRGLVTVTTSRVIEPAVLDEDDDEPRKHRRKFRTNSVPVGMIVGICAGMIVLVGAGIGSYFLINHFRTSPQGKVFERMLADVKTIADAVESIQSPQDVPKAIDQMKDALVDLKQLNEKGRQEGINPESEEGRKLSEKYMPEMLKLTFRMQSAMMKLMANPTIAQAMKEHASKLGSGLGPIAALGRGLDFLAISPSNRGIEESSKPRNNQPPRDDSTASSKPSTSPPEKEQTNPFEPVASGNRSDSAGKDAANPFEQAAPKTNQTPGAGAGSALEATLAKLNSNDHFKKIDGLREAQSATVEESEKTKVLEVLRKLCEDRDVHQKADVLKAYKKWASTEEDHEQLGPHAATLLKDAFAKKDALRYFGENHVISASKEVAYLLKDTFDRKDAAECLIAMGSDAEKAVIPHLTDLEAPVRQMAIEVLARIGTPACIPDLQKLKNDRHVGRAASQAITLINSRKKKSP